ncbi:MAG: DUF6714 family protein [Planctomycetota bacterium]
MPATQTDNAVNQIADAFAGVSLGNGVSLREADVIDDYGTDDERAAAREQDELHDWQRIPDEDIANHSSVLCFMDDEGLRFHLPAYMRFTLRRYRESKSMSTNSTIYRLSDPDCIERLLVYLTDQQIDAIKTFLNTCLEIGDDWLDVSNVPLALRQWHGDEAAARELQAFQAAQIAAAIQMAENFFGLDQELLQKCISGDLTHDEQQHMFALIQNATEKCNPGGLRPKPALWSRALFMLVCVTPFVALGCLMYFRHRQDGMCLAEISWQDIRCERDSLRWIR